MSFEDVNVLAVGLATLLAFLLGAVWYSPALFARQWTAAHGYSEATLKEMQAGATPAYVVSFVCWFVMATVLALVAPHFGQGVGAMIHMGCCSGSASPQPPVSPTTCSPTSRSGCGSSMPAIRWYR